jgi:hypothetical protein
MFRALTRIVLAAAAVSALSAEPLNFEFYRTRVEPIFLKAREEGVSCVGCHSALVTRLRLQVLTNGKTWSEDQSRKNFEAVTKLVAPGEPMKSRLLLHPLASEAGGDPKHTGGKFWKNTNDPEWQTLAEWVRTGTATPGATAAAQPVLDFEFFKTRVQPIFLTKRLGHARCYVCHSTGTPFRLQRLSAGATTWNEEQSRRNFEAAQREVIPGDPQVSQLLVHPLAPEAGGDLFHNGGKHWDSQSNPEWQTLAEWVKGQQAAAGSK